MNTKWTATMLALALMAPLPPALAHTHAPHPDTTAPAKTRPPPLAIGAAFAPTGELWIVGLDAQQHLFVQRSADAGRHWQAPQVLDTGGDQVAADGENRPKLAFGPHGQAVIS